MTSRDTRAVKVLLAHQWVSWDVSGGTVTCKCGVIVYNGVDLPDREMSRHQLEELANAGLLPADKRGAV